MVYEYDAERAGQFMSGPAFILEMYVKEQEPECGPYCRHIKRSDGPFK